MTKNGYRVQLAFMFIFLAALIFFMTRPFFETGFGNISGFGTAFVFPFGLFGKFIPEGTLQTIFTPEHFLLVDSVAGNPVSMGLIVTYAISVIMLISLLYVVISALFALFRTIFDKPYKSRRKRYFVLMIFNLVVIGLCFACDKIESINKMITDGGFVVYQPQLWYYIFTGGLFVAYIMSIIARKKLIAEKTENIE